ncbi:endonuclease 8-like 1 isoform X2 [Oratosquilla oratoria]
MPEGPELYLAAQFINAISKNVLFGGKVVKSEVSKNPNVDWNEDVYHLRAQSRGKELMVILHAGEKEEKGMKSINILFQFGMSGCFKYTGVDELPKHAHLRFFTRNENSPKVLSFVDYRRFGRWEVTGMWSPERGPDPMWEYPAFRENVLNNLHDKAFNKAICEALLNQKFFNGIGNYLRAEILYRFSARPFDCARDLLSEIKLVSKWYDSHMTTKKKKVNCVKPDLLDLCHILPKEVISLGGGKGYDVDVKPEDDSYKEFT